MTKKETSHWEFLFQRPPSLKWIQDHWLYRMTILTARKMLPILVTWLFSFITWNKMWFITQQSDPKMHKEISTVNTGKLVHLTQLIYNLWIQCICKVVLLPTKNDYIHKYIGISRMCEHSTNLCLAFLMFIVQNKAILMTVDTKTITLSVKQGTSMTWQMPGIL